MAWLEQKMFNSPEITFLDWPSYSTHYNPIGNMLAITTLNVYRNNLQYSSRVKFKASIENAWYKINQEIKKNLLFQKRKFLCVLIKRNGNPIRFWDLFNSVNWRHFVAFFVFFWGYIITFFCYYIIIYDMHFIFLFYAIFSAKSKKYLIYGAFKWQCNKIFLRNSCNFFPAIESWLYILKNCLSLRI